MYGLIKSTQIPWVWFSYFKNKATKGCYYANYCGAAIVRTRWAETEALRDGPRGAALERGTGGLDPEGAEGGGANRDKAVHTGKPSGHFN